MLRPGLARNATIASQTRRRMIRPRAIRRTEAHACATTIGLPAPGKDLAVVKGPPRNAILRKPQLHRLRVGLSRVRRQINSPPAVHASRQRRLRGHRATAQQSHDCDHSQHAFIPLPDRPDTQAARARTSRSSAPASFSPPFVALSVSCGTGKTPHSGTRHEAVPFACRQHRRALLAGRLRWPVARLPLRQLRPLKRSPPARKKAP
jgi:hypothetical protein